MRKHGLRPHDWAISSPESTHRKRSEAPLGADPQIHNLRDAASLLPWRGGGCCLWEGGVPATFQLTRLPLWHWAIHSRADQLSRAKSWNNQPRNPVEKTGVYLFSLSGDWVLPEGFRSCSTGWGHSIDVTRKNSGCKYLWSRKMRVFIQTSCPGNPSQTVSTSIILTVQSTSACLYIPETEN